MKYALSILFSAIATFSLITYIFFLPSQIRIGERINFQTADGSFHFMAIPSKGRDYKMMERLYATHLEKTGEEKQQLYRITPINYLNIRKWGNYTARPEWYYPPLPVRKRLGSIKNL